MHLEPVPTSDLASGTTSAVGPAEVEELRRVLLAGGLDIDLNDRYSVMFFYPGIGAGVDYPELAGCTAELCTFADQTTEFVKHGIQLVGLSTRETKPPGDFLTTFPFPVGRLPQEFTSDVVEVIEKPDERFTARTSFVLFPDGNGVRITDVKDPIGHVQRCFDTAIARRLESYQKASLDYLREHGESMKSSMVHTGFLANGADSVSISTVDFGARVVAKLADAAIVGQEAGYMDRINHLLLDNGKPKLFPQIISIETDERPAYYLMEAANPLSLDNLLFEDEAMTKLRADRLHILTDSLQKLSSLYGVTARPEVPKVMRYHYLDRFLAIPQRRDFIDTFEYMFRDAAGLDEVLNAPLLINGDFTCRSFEDQMRWLEKEIDGLLQPVGAYLHGDVHLKNMLVQEDGHSVVFIDPRIIWDGYDVGDPGFADPLYDYGTLLHSIHFSSAILQGIESGQTESLLHWRTSSDDGKLELTTNVLPTTDRTTVEWFTDWLAREVGPEQLGGNWRARLHVNTANAAFGWLKYARAVQTAHAWMSFYVSTLYHLETARRSMEGDEVGT